MAEVLLKWWGETSVSVIKTNCIDLGSKSGYIHLLLIYNSQKRLLEGCDPPFNISSCGHDCCKNGIPVKFRASAKLLKSTPRAATTRKLAKTPTKQCSLSQYRRPADRMSRYVDQLHARATDVLATPAIDRIKVAV